jgi:hypothetical protein
MITLYFPTGGIKTFFTKNLGFLLKAMLYKSGVLGLVKVEKIE